MVTYQSFIADFPEFANAANYPQSAFNFYQNYANILLPQNVWGPPAMAGLPNSLFDIACELFIAHNLAIEAQNQTSVAAGSAPGVGTGIVSSQSADGVSVSFDIAAATIADAGSYNLTTYGVRFLGMALLMGHGPAQVSPPIMGGYGVTGLGGYFPWFGNGFGGGWGF